MKILFMILSSLVVYQVRSQNVGIGTATPTYPLTVISNGSHAGIVQKSGTAEVGFYVSPASAFLQTWSAHDLHFATNNGSAKISVQNSTGFVGINVSNPTAQLDINGTIKIRGGGAATNKLLVSTGSDGNAVWNDVIRNEVYTIHEALFQPERSDYFVVRGLNQGGVSFSTPVSGTYLVAPVALPQGAIVSEVIVYYKDNLPTNLSISLHKESLTSGTFVSPIATGSTTGQNTSWRSVTLTINGGTATIDNSDGAYELRLFGDWPGNTDLAIKGARITYSYAVNN